MYFFSIQCSSGCHLFFLLFLSYLFLFFPPYVFQHFFSLLLESSFLDFMLPILHLRLLPLCPIPSPLLPYLFYHQNYHIIPFHRHKPTDSHLSSDTVSSLGNLFFSNLSYVHYCLVPESTCFCNFSFHHIYSCTYMTCTYSDSYPFPLCLQIEIGTNYPVLCHCNSRSRLDLQRFLFWPSQPLLPGLQIC